jgi:hypothetical protein
MARMSPQRPTDRTDVMIGFLAAFAALFLVVTVVCEVTGRPALSYALILLALVVALVLEVRHRGAIVRRATSGAGELAAGRSDRR